MRAVGTRKETIDVFVKATPFKDNVELSVPKIPIALGFVKEWNVGVCLTRDLLNHFNYGNRTFDWQCKSRRSKGRDITSWGWEQASARWG